MDGHSLVPYLHGYEGSDTVYGEYAGEGTISPVMMIRRGPWKFTTCAVDPPQLFNLKDDPKELRNLTTSADSAVQVIFQALVKEAEERWDLKAIHKQVLKSQRERRLCWDALKQGRFEPWDYQPKEDANQA